MGTVRNWIKDYAALSHPLTDLTHNNTPFHWTNSAQDAMNTLKTAVTKAPAICPINYNSTNKVILTIDSSYLVCGWILLQLDNEGNCCPAQFSSITWNERKSKYSQAKIELYGLFRALKAIIVWLIGIKKLTIEVDAKYMYCHIPYIRASHPKFRMSDPYRIRYDKASSFISCSYNVKHCLFPPFSISSFPVYRLCFLPAMFY